MLSFLRTFFAVIAAVMFLVFAPLVVLVGVALFSDTGPRDHSWLTIRLSGPLLEYYGPSTLVDLVEGPPPCLMEITENLEKAAADDRIDGVIFRIEDFGAGLGKIDEIRAGIRGVREAGKPVFAHAFDLTDAGLYLASECDSTFLFPEGTVYLTGVGVTIQHIKRTLDLLDIHPQFHAIDEYKSMVELFTREEASKEALENLRWEVEDVIAAYDAVLTANRHLEADALDTLRGRAILRATTAHDEGLVDGLLDWHELTDRLKGPRADLRIVSSQDYADVDRGSLDLAGDATVAVVHTQGFVMPGGEDRYDAVVGLAMGVDRVIDDLERAREDRHVSAILLRIDSGGGATSGAQRVARAVERARADKPVIVSIADVAASGGYMMSSPANRVVCPGSGITGSIGVVMGKFNVRGLYQKLGVTFDDLQFAPHAFLFSPLHDWTDDQYQRIAESDWAMYDEWVLNIARERNLSPADVHEAARGQVWTGRQALERGLVDELGGFQEAVALVRQQADLAEDSRLTFIHYPEPETFIDVLLAGDLTRFALGSGVHALGEAFRSSVFSSRSLMWDPRAQRIAR
jgi:protease-4